MLKNILYKFLGININVVIFNYRIEILLMTLLMFLLATLLYQQGVILNDELQLRQHRLEGLINALKWGIDTELSQGRPLRIMAVLNHCFIDAGFQNWYASRIIQICLLYFNTFLLGILVYNILQNKTVSCLSALLNLFFMPIIFEHAVPNAFVGLTAMPVMWLLMSLIFFCRYIEKEQQFPRFTQHNLSYLLVYLGNLRIHQHFLAF